MRTHPFSATFLMAAAVLLTTLGLLSGCKSNPATAAPGVADAQPATSQPAGSAPVQTASAATPAAPAQAAAPAAKPSAGAAPMPAAPPKPAAAPKPAAPPQPAAIDLPAGTSIPIRLDDALGSKISQTGDAFAATVSDDVIVQGQTVIARGARATGTVIDAQPLGKFKGGARLALRLDRVQTRWGTYPVATSAMEEAQSGKGKRSAAMIGGGAGLGALIGGLAGGGKGAAIGGLIGAGAGTAGATMTGNKQIVLPAETLLSFKLQQTVKVIQENR